MEKSILKEKFISFLEKQKIFENFTNDEIEKEIYPYIDIVNYNSGDFFTRNHSKEKSINFVFSGTVQKLDKKSKKPINYLPDFKIGDFFGDMGFLNKTEKSRDFLFLEDSVILRISNNNFLQKNQILYEKFIKNLYKINIDRLNFQITNSSEVKNKINSSENKIKKHTNLFFFQIIILSFFIILNELFKDKYYGDFFYKYNINIDSIIMGLISLPIIILIILKKIPLKTIPIVKYKDRFVRDVLFSLSITIGFILSVTFIKFILIKYYNFEHEIFKLKYKDFSYITLIKIIINSCMVQFIIRSIYQTHLENLLYKEKHLPIFIVSLNYVTFYAYDGFWFSIKYFIISLLLGYLYKFRKNLIEIILIDSLLNLYGKFVGY